MVVNREKPTQWRGIGEHGGFGVRLELHLRHLKVLVQANNRGGGECQTNEIRQGVPKPEVLEDQQPDSGDHVGVASARLQGDGHVAATGVEDATGENRAEFGQQVLMPIGDDLEAALPELRGLGTGDGVLLHEDHRHRDERALSNKVDGAIEELLQQGDGLLVGGSGARDAQSHGRAVAKVRVVGLRQEGHQQGDFLRISEKN